MKGNRKLQYWTAAGIALAAFLIYLPALRNRFVWDDYLFIVNNPYLRSFDLKFVTWAFGYTVSYWHPLTWLSYALDHALWGLNPLGYHLTNIVLHSMNTFVVVILVLKLMKAGQAGTLPAKERPAAARSGLIAAAVTGCLFGLHPLHVESVAWAAERKDVLYALFYLLSILAYAKYADAIDSAPDGKRLFSRFLSRDYLATLGLFTLALFSKPMAVTLPVILLILDWYPFNRIGSFRSFGKVLAEKIPFFAMSAAVSVVTVLAQQSIGALGMMQSTSLSVRVLVAAKALVAYLVKMAWPVDLIPFYSYPRTAGAADFVPVVLVIGISAACIIAARKQRIWLSVWASYAAALLPVLGIIQAGSQSMADRYTYLPGIGPFFLVGLGTARIWKAAQKMHRTGFRIAAAGAGVLVLAALCFGTVKQTGLWKDGIVLWTAVIQEEPTTAPLAYNNRGKAFTQAGLQEQALADLNQAIALDPSYGDAYNNRGLVFGKTGRFDRAIEDFDRAIVLNPGHYEPYNNRGIAYMRLGAPDKAIESFGKALEINPDQAEVSANRGFVYAMSGRYDSALADFDRAIELDPANGMVYYTRAMVRLRTGRSAVDDLRTACALGNREGCAALQQLARPH